MSKPAQPDWKVQKFRILFGFFMITQGTTQENRTVKKRKTWLKLGFADYAWGTTNGTELENLKQTRFCYDNATRGTTKGTELEDLTQTRFCHNIATRGTTKGIELENLKTHLSPVWYSKTSLLTKAYFLQWTIKVYWCWWFIKMQDRNVSTLFRHYIEYCQCPAPGAFIG